MLEIVSVGQASFSYTRLQPLSVLAVIPRDLKMLTRDSLLGVIIVRRIPYIEIDLMQDYLTHVRSVAS